MNSAEVTVKVEFQDVTFDVTVEAEADGNEIYFDLLDVHDECGHSMYTTNHVCALPEHYRELDAEELSSLPRANDVINYFKNNIQGQIKIVKALEALRAEDADNYFYID